MHLKDMSVATSSVALDVMPSVWLCTFAQIGRGTRFPSTLASAFPDPHPDNRQSAHVQVLTGYNSQVATGMKYEVET